MDSTRFDSLTRRIGTASTRRSALRGIVGGLFGLAGLKVAGDAEARNRNRNRNRNSRCGAQYAGCNNENDCCTGLICKELTNPNAQNNFKGTCAYKRGCGKRNDFCKKNRDCCRNFRCQGKRCKRR